MITQDVGELVILPNGTDLSIQECSIPGMFQIIQGGAALVGSFYYSTVSKGYELFWRGGGMTTVWDLAEEPNGLPPEPVLEKIKRLVQRGIAVDRLKLSIGECVDDAFNCRRKILADIDAAIDVGDQESKASLEDAWNLLVDVHDFLVDFYGDLGNA